MTPIRKAVIPAAGFGTRMLPAAKAVPKELLPVLDRPTIQYVVEEAAEAGIADVVFVNSKNKTALLDHFRRNPELEERLAKGGKQALLESLNALIERIRIEEVIQPQQRGLGDAVHQAREAIGNEAFLCLLGDTIFSGSPSPARQLVDAYRELKTSVIGVERVPVEKVDRYGIVGGTEICPGVLRLDTLVEKPPRDSAPSDLAIAARYILTPAIFQCLDETPPGKGGEIQLTDAMRRLLKREPIHAVVLSAHRHDIGNPVDWLKTNILFAQRDTELWAKISPSL
jgi:UTP--glucose-1-phosphate uridylyltransferase